MAQVARGLAQQARTVLSRHGVPWSVIQLGARAEMLFSAAAPANATEVARVRQDALEALLHVYFMNRGVLVTPFHCMMLTCPATLESDAQRFVTVLDGFCSELARRGAVSAPR
jgi:glutamate-1-semialdehyde 2,1-aminomutase